MLKFKVCTKLNSILRTVALAGACTTAIACSEDNFPKYSDLSSLRIVALVANTPEVNTGANVTVTPYVSDSQGAGRALTFSADTCVDFGVAYGAEPTCVGNATKISLAVDQAVTGLSAANVYTGPVNLLSVAIPSDLVMFTGRSSVDQYNGINYLVTFSVKSADGTAEVKSFKRILVSATSKTSKNVNPVLNDINADSVSMTTLPTSTVSLSPFFAAGSNETYQAKDSAGTLVSKTEELTMSWFSTAGSMKYPRTVGSNSNPYTPPSTVPPIGKVVIIGVLRDGRGGTAFVQKTL